MSARQNYLGSECNLGGLSLPEFKAAFCERCTQPECSQSLHGTSKFDQRVANWHDDLFANVPRMEESDPRFATISSQKFLSIGAPKPGVQSAWVDPKDIEAPAGIIVPVALPKPQVRLPLMNTSFQQGTMIGTPPEKAPAKDPWAGPKKSAIGNETIVKPGTKVKLGGVPGK